jgi:hypothetical protein
MGQSCDATEKQRPPPIVFQEVPWRWSILRAAIRFSRCCEFFEGGLEEPMAGHVSGDRRQHMEILVHRGPPGRQRGTQYLVLTLERYRDEGSPGAASQFQVGTIATASMLGTWAFHELQVSWLPSSWIGRCCRSAMSGETLRPGHIRRVSPRSRSVNTSRKPRLGQELQTVLRIVQIRVRVDALTYNVVN